MKSPTRHSSLWCLLTEHRSTLSVFCCRAVWEMATLNTSLNNRDSAAGWTFVRNRQLTSVEEGSRATLKYLQRTRMKWISLVQLYWIHSWCLKLSAWERHGLHLSPKLCCHHDRHAQGHRGSVLNPPVLRIMQG